MRRAHPYTGRLAATAYNWQSHSIAHSGVLAMASASAQLGFALHDVSLHGGRHKSHGGLEQDSGFPYKAARMIHVCNMCACVLEHSPAKGRLARWLQRFV